MKSTSTNQTLINQNSSTAASVISENHSRMNEEIPIRPKEMNEYLMWHVWMKHAGPNRLLKTVDVVVGINKKIAVDKNKCVICSLNKMMNVINRLFPLRAIKMLEWVFSDYWNKYRVVGSKNKKHFLSFMNDYSKMSVIYICNRNKTKRHFNMYKNMMKKQFEKKLQRIRSNNECEYFAMKISLKTNEIHLKTTTIYIFEQNEMTKKLNKTLITTAKEMLLWSGLPKKFWNEAILTANYIWNRLSARDLKNKTSYEMWHERKSSIGHIKTFECLMYIHIFSEIKNKINKMFDANIFVKY